MQMHEVSLVLESHPLLMISIEGASSSKNQVQARPVEKRKWQSEDARDEDWLEDTSGVKSKKRTCHDYVQPRTASAVKIGPPRGAKRKDQPKQTAADGSSSTCLQKPSQAIPKATTLVVIPSCAKPSLTDPIRLREEEKEESSEENLNGSQEPPSISESNGFHNMTAHDSESHSFPLSNHGCVNSELEPEEWGSRSEKKPNGRMDLSKLESHGREHPVMVNSPGACPLRHFVALLTMTTFPRFTWN